MKSKQKIQPIVYVILTASTAVAAAAVRSRLNQYSAGVSRFNI